MAEVLKENYKVAIIGAQRVGKTFLAHALASMHLPANYESTVGVEFMTRRSNTTQDITLYDTSGNPVMMPAALPFIKSSDMILFVCDATSYESFLTLQSKFNMIQQNDCLNANHRIKPMALVCTQIDGCVCKNYKVWASKFADDINAECAMYGRKRSATNMSVHYVSSTLKTGILELVNDIKLRASSKEPEADVCQLM
jgi:hypothetical protein